MLAVAWRLNPEPAQSSDVMADPNLKGCNAGIMGTPTIDLQNQVMYFVANTNGQFYFHAIRLADGSDVQQGGVPISAPGFYANQQMQRPALLLTNDHILAGFGSHADYPPFQGWLFSFRRDNLQQDAAQPLFPPAPTPTDTTDICGDQGNHKNGGSFVPQTYADYSNSILQVDPVNFGNSNCTPLSTGLTGCPSGQQTTPWAAELSRAYSTVPLADSHGNPVRDDWDTMDGDLGSSRVLLVGQSAITIGKFGTLVMVNSVTNPDDSTNVVAADVCSGYDLVWNSFAYWNGSVYVWCSGYPLQRFSLQSLTTTAYGIGQYNPALGFPPTPPSLASPDPPTGLISSAGAGAAISISASSVTNQDCANYNGNAMCGIVWATYPVVDATFYPTAGYFIAYDATTFQVLYRSYLGDEIVLPELPGYLMRNEGPAWMKFTPPVVANGRVYVATASNVVNVYGLVPPIRRTGITR
jgi:hypothetical protein